MQNLKPKIKETAVRIFETLKPALLITKKIFIYIIKYLYKYFNDNGKPCVHRSLILIFLFSIQMTMFQYVIQGSNLLQWDGAIYLNFVPIFLVCCLLYFTIGKTAIVFSICVSIISLLHTINYYKIKFRDEPLNPTDFSLGKEAGNIVHGYDLTMDPEIKYIVFILLTTVILSFLILRNKRPNWKISVIGTVVTLIVSMILYSTVYKSTKIYDSFQVNHNMYHETEIVSAQGLIYSLINKSSALSYEKPEGYSKEKAKEILNRYPKAVIDENSPNIIAIMCEAYSDIQTWSDVPFVSENPYKYFNELKANGCYGKIFVPFFGGGTSSTEFEFLTGNNTSAISTLMPSAYASIIASNSYSIAHHFKEFGYKTYAIHPGHPWFYNRQNVYPRLGFDKFTSKDDLPPGTKEVNYYIADDVTSDLIIDGYENHLKTNPDEGYFSFTVTIQNHGPYGNDSLFADTEYISKDLGLSDEEYYIINNYLEGIKDGNALLKKVYDYINTVDEPTVLILFGDHLPYLDSEEELFLKLGIDTESNTHEAYINRYSTDYLIIGNNAYLENNTPSINGQQELISSNYLSVKLFQYANMQLPQFQAFLYDMMQYAPIISKQHIGTPAPDGKASAEFDNMFKEYKILQYYNLRDYSTK